MCSTPVLGIVLDGWDFCVVRECSGKSSLRIPGPDVDREKMLDIPGLRSIKYKTHLGRNIDPKTTLEFVHLNKNLLLYKNVCFPKRNPTQVYKHPNLCCHNTLGSRSWRRARKQWLVNLRMPQASAYRRVLFGFSLPSCFIRSQNLFTLGEVLAG